MLIAMGPRSARRLACGLIALGSLLAAASAAPAPAPAPSPAPAPAALALADGIYNLGRLPSGAPVTGRRDQRLPAVGAAAACANCHRPSGLGQVEGDAYVPPIAGNFLFAPRGAQGVLTMDPRVSKSFNRSHEPYNEETLIRAIRDGINSEGRQMSVLMPRYELDASTHAALATYLRQLSTQWSPGVDANTISVATIITPEVDAPRRKTFLSMMQTIVRLKNASTAVASQKKNRHHMVTAAEMVLGTERNWDLQVWELQGPADTWSSQIEERYRAHPVFAVVSGLSDTSWQPVQDFCEHQRVPCWFPSVPASTAEPGKYTFYFSAGVRLEAALLSRQLTGGSGPEDHRGHRLIQVYRMGEPGSTAALAVRNALAGTGVEVVDRVIPAQAVAAESVRNILTAADHDDALVFWLRPEDLKPMDALDAPRGETYFSGSLAQGEAAPIPQAWRARAHLIYPYQLPQLRARNLDYFHAWLNLHQIPMIDEAMQSEVYFAMSFLTDTLAEMLDNLYRDYLVERAEEMLSKRESNKVEQETRDSKALGREGDLLQRRGPMTMDESVRLKPMTGMDIMTMNTGTTVYAHLSLGAGQRYASKSGYIVHFSGPSGNALTADTPLLAP